MLGYVCTSDNRPYYVMHRQTAVTAALSSNNVLLLTLIYSQLPYLNVWLKGYSVLGDVILKTRARSRYVLNPEAHWCLTTIAVAILRRFDVRISHNTLMEADC